MTHTEAILSILVIALATFITRSAPFFFFPPGKTTPKYIVYLGKALPCATIAMLIIYCVKNVKPLDWPHGLAEIISITIVSLIQHYGKNILISIAVGTILYMFLIQKIFI